MHEIIRPPCRDSFGVIARSSGTIAVGVAVGVVAVAVGVVAGGVGGGLGLIDEHAMHESVREEETVAAQG